MILLRSKSDSKKEAQDSSSEWIVPDKPLVETTNNLGGGVLNDIRYGFIFAL